MTQFYLFFVYIFINVNHISSTHRLSRICWDISEHIFISKFLCLILLLFLAQLVGVPRIMSIIYICIAWTNIVWSFELALRVLHTYRRRNPTPANGQSAKNTHNRFSSRRVFPVRKWTWTERRYTRARTVKTSTSVNVWMSSCV